MSDVMERPTTTGSASAGSRPPARPSVDDGEREPRKIPWRTIAATIVAIVAAAIAIVVTVQVMDNRAEAQLREERRTNAARDLNNRAQTEDIGGSFTRVFYVGNELRATFVRDDGLKRCNMRVNPPTEEVLRYSTSDVPATDASFRMLDNPDAIGCLEASGGGGVGGG